MPREDGIAQVGSLRKLDWMDFLINTKVTSPFIRNLCELWNHTELIFNVLLLTPG